MKVKDEPTPTKDEKEDYEMKRLRTELDNLRMDYEKKELETENHSLKELYETQKSLHHILLDYVVHLNKLNKNS